MNNQNKDGNGMDSALVKEKYNTCPSEATEDTENTKKTKSRRIRTTI